MGAEVFFWWMIATGYSGYTTVPVPYQTQEMCEWAGKEAGILRGEYKCIPQPAADAAEYAATMAAVRPDVCELDEGLTNPPQ